MVLIPAKFCGALWLSVLGRRSVHLKVAVLSFWSPSSSDFVFVSCLPFVVWFALRSWLIQTAVSGCGVSCAPFLGIRSFQDCSDRLRACFSLCIGVCVCVCCVSCCFLFTADVFCFLFFLSVCVFGQTHVRGLALHPTRVRVVNRPLLSAGLWLLPVRWRSPQVSGSLWDRGTTCVDGGNRALVIGF